MAKGPLQRNPESPEFPAWGPTPPRRGAGPPGGAVVAPIFPPGSSPWWLNQSASSRVGPISNTFDVDKYRGQVPDLDLSGYLNPNWGAVGRYQQRTPDEYANLRNVSMIGRMLGGGTEGYTQALNYYRDILGGSRAAAQRAVAPAAEMLAETYKGAERGLEQGSLRGGARDAAMGDLARKRAGDIGGLIMRLQPEAAQAAGSLGLQGATAGAGLQQQAAAMDQANRQAAQQMEQSNRFGGAGLLLQKHGMDINEALGFGGLDLQGQLGFGGLNLQRDLGMAGLTQQESDLALRRELGLGGLDLQRQQLEMERQRAAAQQKAQKGAKWGNLLGSALQAGSMFIPGAGPFVSAGIGAARSGMANRGGGGGGSVPYYLARPTPSPWTP